MFQVVFCIVITGSYLPLLQHWNAFAINCRVSSTASLSLSVHVVYARQLGMKSDVVSWAWNIGRLARTAVQEGNETLVKLSDNLCPLAWIDYRWKVDALYEYGKPPKIFFYINIKKNKICKSNVLHGGENTR